MSFLSKFFAMVSACCAASAAAQTADEDRNPASPRIIAESEGLIAGRVNTLALTFDIQDGWHVYWRGQNDTGFPVAAAFEVTGGDLWGRLLWPAGKRYESKGGILDYVYDGEEATLLLPVFVPESTEPGSEVIVKADVEWLVCREACIPGWATVEAAFEVLPSGSAPSAGPDADRIRAARDRLPRPWVPRDSARVAVRWAGVGTDAERLEVEAKGEGVKMVSFLPDEDGRVLRDALKTGASSDGALRLRFAPGPDGEPGAPVIGVLVVERAVEGGGVERDLYRIETSPGDEPG